MPLKGPTYHKGEKVTYTSFGKSCEALIVGAHLDDELEPYYTIQLPDGREKQTDDAHLSPLVLQPPPAAQQPPPTMSSSSSSSLQPQAPMPRQPPPSPPPPPLSSAQPNMVFKNQSAPTIRKEQQLPKPQDRPWEEVNDTKVLPKPKPEQPTTFRSTQRRHDTMKQHPSSSSSSSAARGGELPSDGREKEHSHNHQQYQPSSSSRKKQQQQHYHKMGNNHTTTTQQKQKQQSSHSRSRRRSSQKQQRQQPHQSAASASHHPYDHPSYNSHRRRQTQHPPSRYDDPWQMHPFGRSHRSSMFGSGGGFDGGSSGMMPTTIRSRL